MNKKQELNELFHVLFCKFPHDPQPESLATREEGVCYYIAENTLTNAYDQPDHQRMEVLVFALMAELEIESVDELYDFMRILIDRIQDLNDVISEHPAISKYVAEWLSEPSAYE